MSAPKHKFAFGCVGEQASARRVGLSLVTSTSQLLISTLTMLGALLECLELHVRVLKEMYRASSYASMRYHEDTRVGVTAGMEQRAGLVATRLSEAASFVLYLRLK